MTRLLTAIRTDVIVQLRTNLYVVGIGAAIIVAVAMAWLSTPERLPAYMPTLLLLVVGGTTLLYVGAIMLFEKDEGTLSATLVSPLRSSEYLWSKVLSLTALATLESVVMIGGATLIMSFSVDVTLPNIPILLVGIIGIGVLYTLIGIIIIVRLDAITDFLILMGLVATVLQLPFLYFLGWVEHPLLLVIPTSAPTVIMQGAYRALSAGEWLYAIGYTAALLVGLTVWAQRAFHRHLVVRVGS